MFGYLTWQIIFTSDICQNSSWSKYCLHFKHDLTLKVNPYLTAVKAKNQNQNQNQKQL